MSFPESQLDFSLRSTDVSLCSATGSWSSWLTLDRQPNSRQNDSLFTPDPKSAHCGLFKDPNTAMCRKTLCNGSHEHGLSNGVYHNYGQTDNEVDLRHGLSDNVNKAHQEIRHWLTDGSSYPPSGVSSPSDCGTQFCSNNHMTSDVRDMHHCQSERHCHNRPSQSESTFNAQERANYVRNCCSVSQKQSSSNPAKSPIVDNLILEPQNIIKFDPQTKAKLRRQIAQCLKDEIQKAKSYVEKETNRMRNYFDRGSKQDQRRCFTAKRKASTADNAALDQPYLNKLDNTLRQCARNDAKYKQTRRQGRHSLSRDNICLRGRRSSASEGTLPPRPRSANPAGSQSHSFGDMRYNLQNKLPAGKTEQCTHKTQDRRHDNTLCRQKSSKRQQNPQQGNTNQVIGKSQTSHMECIGRSIRPESKRTDSILERILYIDACNNQPQQSTSNECCGQNECGQQCSHHHTSAQESSNFTEPQTHTHTSQSGQNTSERSIGRVRQEHMERLHNLPDNATSEEVRRLVTALATAMRKTNQPEHTYDNSSKHYHCYQDNHVGYKRTGQDRSSRTRRRLPADPKIHFSSQTADPLSCATFLKSSQCSEKSKSRSRSCHACSHSDPTNSSHKNHNETSSLITRSTPKSLPTWSSPKNYGCTRRNLNETFDVDKDDELKAELRAIFLNKKPAHVSQPFISGRHNDTVNVNTDSDLREDLRAIFLKNNRASATRSNIHSKQCTEEEASLSKENTAFQRYSKCDHETGECNSVPCRSHALHGTDNNASQTLRNIERQCFMLQTNNGNDDSVPNGDRDYQCERPVSGCHVDTVSNSEPCHRRDLSRCTQSILQHLQNSDTYSFDTMVRPENGIFITQSGDQNPARIQFRRQSNIESRSKPVPCPHGDASVHYQTNVRSPLLVNYFQENRSRNAEGCDVYDRSGGASRPISSDHWRSDTDRSNMVKFVTERVPNVDTKHGSRLTDKFQTDSFDLDDLSCSLDTVLTNTSLSKQLLDLGYDSSSNDMKQYPEEIFLDKYLKTKNKPATSSAGASKEHDHAETLIDSGTPKNVNTVKDGSPDNTNSRNRTLDMKKSVSQVLVFDTSSQRVFWAQKVGLQDSPEDTEDTSRLDSDARSSSGSSRSHKEVDNLHEKGSSQKPEKNSSSHRPEEKSPSQMSDDKSPSQKSDDKSQSHKSDDKSQSHKSDNKSPSHKSDDKSPSHKSDDKSPSHKSDDKSPSHKSDDKSPSHKSDDKSPSHKPGETSPSQNTTYSLSDTTATRKPPSPWTAEMYERDSFEDKANGSCSSLSAERLTNLKTSTKALLTEVYEKYYARSEKAIMPDLGKALEFLENFSPICPVDVNTPYTTTVNNQVRRSDSGNAVVTIINRCEDSNMLVQADIQNRKVSTDKSASSTESEAMRPRVNATFVKSESTNSTPTTTTISTNEETCKNEREIKFSQNGGSQNVDDSSDLHDLKNRLVERETPRFIDVTHVKPTVQVKSYVVSSATPVSVKALDAKSPDANKGRETRGHGLHSFGKPRVRSKSQDRKAAQRSSHDLQVNQAKARTVSSKSYTVLAADGQGKPCSREANVKQFNEKQSEISLTSVSSSEDSQPRLDETSEWDYSENNCNSRPIQDQLMDLVGRITLPMFQDENNSNTTASRPCCKILGELAFQLERRILDYVFGLEGSKRRLFIGYTVSNIKQMIEKEKRDAEGHEEAENKGAFATRLDKILTALQKFGYNIEVHGEFAQKLVTEYGLLACPPDQNTIEEFGLQDSHRIAQLIEHIASGQSDAKELNTMLRCLKYLSKCDGRPLFVW